MGGGFQATPLPVVVALDFFQGSYLLVADFFSGWCLCADTRGGPDCSDGIIITTIVEYCSNTCSSEFS